MLQVFKSDHGARFSQRKDVELRVRRVAHSAAGPRHRHDRHAAHEETTVRLLAERDRETEHARSTPVGEHLDVPAT